MEQEYITNPNINGGEPIPVYEMGKVVPGSPLWEVIQQQQKENSPYLTAATAREIKSYPELVQFYCTISAPKFQERSRNNGIIQTA